MAKRSKSRRSGGYRKPTRRVRRVASRGRSRGGVQTVRIELVQPRAPADPQMIGLKPSAAPRRSPF